MAKELVTEERKWWLGEVMILLVVVEGKEWMIIEMWKRLEVVKKQEEENERKKMVSQEWKFWILFA